MSPRSRRRHRRSRNAVARRVRRVLLLVLALIVLSVAGTGIWVLDVRASAPSIDQLKPISDGSVSEVLAADGSRLGYIESDAIRQPVPIGQIPRVLQHATVATEDEHFYEHNGVDWEAVIRAAWDDVRAGFRAEEGGSTITQQLVKNLYIANPQETIKRKIIEATLAEVLEDEHSKTWIL